MSDVAENPYGTEEETAHAEASPQAEDEMTLEELAAMCDNRAATYGLIARLYYAEVDEALFDELVAMRYPVSSGNDLLDRGYYTLAKYLSNAWVDPVLRLSVDYTKTFLGSGIDTYSAAYPFESVYTSEKRLLMQDARDEVLAIYRSCGLDKSASWKTGEDHIAVELEFMRIMSARTAKALRAGDEDEATALLSTQKNFMLDHVATWAPVFCNDVRRFAGTTFYQALADVTEGFLEEDAALLEGLVED
ncbi:TorD/DmsD family molecular chaperone [Xiamenia xianingshaonis]|uniref:TorD/DmsD family molecular chaperone n=1 Tax=Xiamenia xianingshaonis TaxID=2682776 RepID=UPI0021BD2EAF|nr:molecular chaperone TorD family protein [Xiamenia xianingshaonis]